MLLCNPNKYYVDPQLLIPVSRTPRPTEDIEIVGLVETPEMISLSTERGSACRTTEISSITINFANPLNSFTIYDSPGSTIISGGSLHMVNSRQPNPAALLSISGNNPLRFQHGWYTINTGRAILNISTNARLVLNNVGLTNNNINCNECDITNKSCYANGNINSPYLYIGDSFAYNINTNPNVYYIYNESKVDNIYLQTRTGYIFNSSVADSEISHFYCRIDTSNIIDSKLEYYQGVILNSKIQSQIYESDSLLIPGLAIEQYRTDIRDTKILKNGIVQGTVIIAANVELSGGTLACYILNGIQGDLNIGETQAERNTPVSVFREGKLLADNVDTATVSGLSNICGTIEIKSIYNRYFPDGPPLNIINNGGTTDIGSLSNPYYINTILLSSCSGAKNIIRNNVVISGGYSTDSTIEGDFLRLNRFLNSGIIKTKSSELTYTNNYGIINDAIFLSGSVNHESGIVSKGIFKNNSINYGSVTQGIFTHKSTNNGNVSNATFSGTYSDGLSQAGPLINNGFVNNGVFSTPLSIPKNDRGFPISYEMMEVANKGSGNTINIAGFAKNDGAVYKLLTVRDSGQNLSPTPTKIEFYDTSMNISAITGQAIFKNNSKNYYGGGSGSVQDYYNNTSVQFHPLYGPGSFFLSKCNFYDYSFISGLAGTTSGEMNFYDFSQLNNGTLDSGIFYDSSKIVGGPVTAALLYFKDNSSCSGDLNIGSGLFLDESINRNTILANYIKFANTSKNLGIIDGSTAEFTDNALNTGLIRVSSVSFQQSATNAGQITESSWVNFLENSINNGLISSSTNVFFDQSSINRGPIMGFLIASFFNNAQSYAAEPLSFFIDIGVYKSNSINLDNINVPAIIAGTDILFSGSINYASLTATNVIFNNAENNASVVFTTRNSNGLLSGIPGIYAAIKGCENVSFVSGSTNSGPIKGCNSVTYNNSTNNSKLSSINTINFNSSNNNGSIYADVSFNNYSTNNGFISGNVTFTNHSHNYGQISGTVCFDNTSFNYGEVLEINCA